MNNRVIGLQFLYKAPRNTINQHIFVQENIYTFLMKIFINKVTFFARQTCHRAKHQDQDQHELSFFIVIRSKNNHKNPLDSQHEKG